MEVLLHPDHGSPTLGSPLLQKAVKYLEPELDVAALVDICMLTTRVVSFE